MPSNQKQKKRTITLTLNITVMTDFMEKVVTETLTSFASAMSTAQGARDIDYKIETVETKKSEAKEPA